MDQTSSPKKSSNNVTQAGSPVNLSRSGSGKRTLLKAAGVMGLMTLASRVLGMIRDIVSARTFGTTWHWDAFVYAFMLPNFFRRLVGEGALSNAFIPVYSEIREKEGPEKANRFASIVLTFLAVVILCFMLGIESLLHWTLNSVSLPERLYLTLDLLRVLFPYLWFISLYALCMGILHCHKHFFSPALGPVILDLMWIAGILWLVPAAGPEINVQLRWLSYMLVVAGLVQLLVEVPALYRRGFRYRWTFQWKHAGLRKTLKLFLPATMSFAIVQINILVDMTLGFMLGSGANSSLWYGTRLMQFPLGVFAIAMGTALLPMISEHNARKDLEAARTTLSFALRSVFLIILPASIGLIVLRHPIIQMLFERGEFDAISTARTSAVLLCYSIGLFGYSGQKIIASGFYAAQDPKTPVKIGLMAVAANFGLNLILMQFLREAGLALATSITGILQFVLLMFFYQRRIMAFSMQEVLKSFAKISAASLLMGVFCAACFGWLSRMWPADSTVSLLVQVSTSIVLSAAAFISLCFVFRVHEVREAWVWMRNRRPVKPENADLSDVTD